jgi:antitoxin component YwqK of YwqJK toxin-antitoxin module
MELLKFFIVSKNYSNTGIKVCNLEQGVHYDFTKEKKDTYKDGKRDGRSTWWYKNGHPYEDDYWVDGQRHGLCHYWYKNGQLEIEYNYVNGQRHGLCYEWYEDGQLQYERRYDNGH